MRHRVCAALAAAIATVSGAESTAQGLAPTYGPAAPAGSPERCAALAALALPDLVVIEAALVTAGPFELPATGRSPVRSETLPAFCRVRGTVAPEIRFEVWLPEDADWNGRFQAVGGGGFAGVISHAAMARAVASGYATASTDTGHQAPELEWLGDPRRLRDYGYRAIYEMTAKAKAAIEAYYDRPADFDYFNGCSTGGRQGLMQAQRFPSDYDGIVSGAPVNHFVAAHFTQLWIALATKPVADEPNLPADDLSRVNDAVLAQCDTLDGIADGVIEDPRRCNFDPGTLQCGDATTGWCLRADQATSLRKIYAGPTHAETGERLHPGLAPGGEPTWSVVSASGLVDIPREYFKRSVFGDPDWDWRSFDFAGDVGLAFDETGTILDATDPDLAEFRDAGGKLIVYHGWNDQVIFPEGSIEYYEDVETTLTAQANPSGRPVRDFFRLFMVPGMTHCRGGPGTDQFDAQRAIEDWVERGIAPDRIEASRAENGRITRTRPLCPYPQIARYRGTGDPDRAESFDCTR